MLSVGEVMAIGRFIEEVMQKACRMVNPALNGLEGRDSKLVPCQKTTPLEEQMRKATDTRLFAVQTALEDGWSVDQVHDVTKIDKWFLAKLKNIAKMRKTCIEAGDISTLMEKNGVERMKSLKMAGFSDKQIANYVNKTGPDGESEIRSIRKSVGVVPCVKQIDTLAAEFPAHTNYLYITYSGDAHDVEESQYYLPSFKKNLSRSASGTEFQSRLRSLSEVNDAKTTLKDKGVMVLGCGAYCIGSSVEFDWCAVSAVRQLRRDGIKSVIINYNPETVSTDYDESDRLYFEELSVERVLDIYEHEGVEGIIVSVGGQIPNNIAGPIC